MLFFYRWMLLLTAISICNCLQAQNRERVIDSLTNLLNQSKADTNRARLYLMIGDRYEQKNDSISIDYYYKAIALSAGLQYKWGEAVGRQYLAEVYTRTNKYDSAAHHLEKVMELSKLLKDDKRIGIAANSMAIIHYRNGDFESALRYYLLAAEHFEKREDLRIQLISCYSIAWQSDGGR